MPRSPRFAVVDHTEWCFVAAAPEAQIHMEWSYCPIPFIASTSDQTEWKREWEYWAILEPCHLQVAVPSNPLANSFKTTGLPFLAYFIC